MASTPITAATPTGRVVRLHFSCRAELPIGSFLRVTGGSLWAPTSLTSPADPMNAHSIAQSQAGEAGYQTYGNDTEDGVEYWYSSHPTNLYASSVEMVTSPDTYPIWTTRQPVVVVIHGPTTSTIQRHYYRYLVVTPGATDAHPTELGLLDDDMPVSNMDISTSDGRDGAAPVMMWEQPPFPGMTGTGTTGTGAGATSSSFLHGVPSTSTLGDVTAMGNESSTTQQFLQLAQLPYRTLDIRIETATASPHPVSDTWNGVDDVTYQAYRIRESMVQEKDRADAIRRAEERRSAAVALSLTGTTTPAGLLDDQSSLSDDAVMSGGNGTSSGNGNVGSVEETMVDIDDVDDPDATANVANADADAAAGSGGGEGVDMTGIMSSIAAAASTIKRQQQQLLPPQGPPPRILFICFHLPVVVVKVAGEWQATWSESLLASKDGSQVVANYRAHWVGTVTPHPPIVHEEDRKAVRALLKDMDCTPIFLNPSTRQAHYYGFCKQVLWPAFHNIDLLDLSTTSSTGADSTTTTTGGGDGSAAMSEWDQSRLDHWWHAYQQVNLEFATAVQDLVSQEDGILLGGALDGMMLGGGGGGTSSAGSGSYVNDSTYLWIHDYHLSLLPRYLARDGTSTKFCRKVFFLHIPFPTSQIFRELECGEDILHGMLHADVVGFHAFDHARHFLNASKRIMGLNYESLVGGLIGVSYQGRTVLVSMSNVSIEPKMVDAALKLPSVEEGCRALQAAHTNGGSSGKERRQIISSLDVGQRLSGSSLRLLAYERLLQDYPVWQSKVVMVLRVLVPGSRKRDEHFTTRELRSIVQRIHDKFGPAVIDYKEVMGSTLPMDQRLALWRATDVLMLTPIREGLNHWPMEYIYCKRNTAPGVVIASEFSAVCSILNGALRVNPFDIQMTVTVMDKALTMDHEEKEGRQYRDIDFVTNSPSDRWVKNVLRDLNDAYAASGAANASKSGSHSPHTPTPGGRRTPGHQRTLSLLRKDEIQGTAAFLLKESHASFFHLNPKVLKQAYDATSRRVIILDFNGTIVLKEPPGKYLKREILGTSGNKPPPQVLEALALLCRDPKNTVYVVSGDSSENVLSALGHIHNLGLAVSNGAKFSAPMQEKDEERRWQTFDLGVDWDAVKRVALPVLSKYTARSNGSFVKLTTLSIGWSYYSCDPEWGSLQASHLVLELENHLKAFDVRFVTLKGVVEIVPRRLNKGLIVKKVLRDISKTPTEPPIDFCLCLGDDISDEKMFTSVLSFIAEMGDASAAHMDPPVINADGTVEEPKPASAMAGKPVPDPMYCFTCAVGKKPSHASMYVTDAQEVANALVLLVKGEFPQGGVHAAWGRDTNQDMFT